MAKLFSQNLLQMAPFKEIKKSIAPRNKITQKHLFLFAFHLQLKNIQCKFQNNTTLWHPYGSFTVHALFLDPLLLVAPENLSWPLRGRLAQFGKPCFKYC